LRREVSELKLRQAQAPVSRDIEEFLDRLNGDVELTEYLLTDDVAGGFSGYDARRFRFRNYRASGSTVKITKRTFAHGMLFGLLVSDRADKALSRGFASEEADDSGYPLTILAKDEYKDEYSEVDDLFMSLERDGIVVYGEKISDNFIHDDSFAMTYTWNLSNSARIWILKNPPSSRHVE